MRKCAFVRVCEEGEGVVMCAQMLVCICERVILLIQHVTRRNIAICALSRSTVFSTSSQKRHYFREKKILDIKYVF